MSNQKPILALFPGQGSQSVGMGRELFDEFELAKGLFAEADMALGFELSKICFEGPAERLTATEIAQPAILTVSTICYRLYRAGRGAGANIVAAAGHSLGEYSALLAAGALSFSDAVQLVHKRGRYMQEAVPRGQGKMVAVLGGEIGPIEEAISKVSDGLAQIANINAPGQIVVSGDAAGIDQFVKLLAGAKAKELPVSAPFHCGLMKPAEENLARDLKALSISPCKFPVYSNYTAQPVQEPEAVREALRLQVCGRVRWVESMENAVRDHNPIEAIEFGAGNVLTGLLKRICPDLGRLNVNSKTSLSLA